MFRLEVKAASTTSHEGRGHYTYSFQVQRRSADWYAFVALDKEMLFLEPRANLKPYTTHRFGEGAFSHLRMMTSIRGLIRTLETQADVLEAA